MACHISFRRPEDIGAPKRIVTAYVFWIFILSDMVMFSAFFAAYAVLLGQTAGRPSRGQLFDPQCCDRNHIPFGVLIVMLVIGGSLWIMANLNHNMMPMDQLMQLQRWLHADSIDVDHSCVSLGTRIKASFRFD